MKAEYSADELLPLSGIQHFQFCRRQWALIYVENQWHENVLTTEGKIMHQRVDDPYADETRNGMIAARSMPVASYRLGLSGICDLVEFHPSPDGIQLPGRVGFFQPFPVEYKHGKEKRDPCDEVQLCAQAICLEEMLSTRIPTGYLFYGQTRHRLEVQLNDELRNLVNDISEEMHTYFNRGYTPKVKPTKACQSCSLADICLPELLENRPSASGYIKKQIDES
jgi:CRISPR-associated exonuclease Cas4